MLQKFLYEGPGEGAKEALERHPREAPKLPAPENPAERHSWRSLREGSRGQENPHDKAATGRLLWGAAMQKVGLF